MNIARANYFKFAAFHRRLPSYGFTLTAIAIAFTGALPLASAQTAADVQEGARALERIQREQQYQQQQQFLKDRQSAQPRTGIEIEIEIETAPTKPFSNAGECVNATRVVIIGARHLPEGIRASLKNRFEGRCVTVGGLETILAEITASYISHGLIASRAYVQKQDASTGTIEILVVEGTVESISVEGSGVATANAFPGVVGAPLNLRDAEQGLDQVNRLGSNNAKLEVAPGLMPGSSVVLIKNQPVTPWRLALSADNQGSISTGRDQVSASLSIDNPLGFGDFISLTHRRTVPANDPSQLAESNSLSYILPYGYQTFSLGTSDSKYVTQVKTAGGQSLKSNGTNGTTFLNAERVVYRDGLSRLNTSATFTNKDSQNYLAEQFLQVSSRNLSVLDLDANYTTGVLSSIVGLQLGISKGLTLAGALKDADALPDGFPKAQFLKVRYGGSLAVPIQAAGHDAAFSTQLSGQYAEDSLFGSEQISVGGLYSVRGFADTSLSGDSGLTVRNDLSVRIPLNTDTAFPVVIKPYIALDYGLVKPRNGNPGGELTGMAIGVSLAGGRVYVDIFSALPLVVADGMRRESQRTYVSIRLTL
jgi:hemolysin activation/secretion protein